MRILKNCRIHTLDPRQPLAEALAIDDHAPHAGRVLGVGSNDAIQVEFGHRAEVEDMAGNVILPGLTDAHIHLRHYALGLQKIDLSGQSKAACLEAVAGRAAKMPPGAWILGQGWNQNLWPDGYGSSADLDAVAPNHPVFLQATSLHAAWANGAALKAAGIAAHTPDPPKGTIQRDPSGAPTGILFEAAMDLVQAAIPEPTPEENEKALLAAQQTLWRLGLTGAHDFDRRRSFLALQSLHQRGELKLRVLKHIPVERLDYAIGAGLRTGFGDDMLRIGSVKVFADGALGQRTAAMFEPYQGEPQNRGMLFVDGEQLFETSRQAAMGGLSMTVHAIGDRANHEVLAAFEHLRQFEGQSGLPALRHRIEHVQALHPDDLGRLAQLDLTASMQPIHATSDMDMADRYWGDRSQHAYAWRTLEERGTRLAFGSDAPVDSPNPFWGLHAALTRQRRDGSPGPEGWYPRQRLSLETALGAYTLGPAYLAGMGDRLGRLAPGYLADLIVLEQDPFSLPPADLWGLRPAATMLGGDWVWRA